VNGHGVRLIMKIIITLSFIVMAVDI
jgi:hypothetical protein